MHTPTALAAPSPPPAITRGAGRDAPRDRTQQWLAAIAAGLALVVVGLGAWVRLSDAGLGCPDWPGCYGHLLGVPDSAQEHAAAAVAYPDRPPTPPKPGRKWSIATPPARWAC